MDLEEKYIEINNKTKSLEKIMRMSNEDIKKEEKALLEKYQVKRAKLLTKEQKQELTINKNFENLLYICKAYMELDSEGVLRREGTTSVPDNLYFFAWKFKVFAARKDANPLFKKFFQNKLNDFYDRDLFSESVRILYGKEVMQCSSKLNSVENTALTFTAFKNYKLDEENCRSLYEGGLVDLRFFDFDIIKKIVSPKVLYEEFNDTKLTVANSAFLSAKYDGQKDKKTFDDLFKEEFLQALREKYLEEEMKKHKHLENNRVKKKI